MNTLYKKKIFAWSLIFIILSIVSIVILLQTEFKEYVDAILEVDNNKNFSLRFSTSNINFLNNPKDIYIIIENKSFYLYDIEFIYQGNNIYRINFSNDELYKLIKTNSLYSVKIFYSTKKLHEILF